MIGELDQDAIAIFCSVVPDEEKVVETVEVGPTEGNEVVEGEVVGDGEDEEKRRGRGVGRGSEQVERASALAEFRVVGLGLEDGSGIQRVLLFH